MRQELNCCDVSFVQELADEELIMNGPETGEPLLRLFGVFNRYRHSKNDEAHVN